MSGDNKRRAKGAAVECKILHSDPPVGTGLLDPSRHMCRQTTPTFADPSAKVGLRVPAGIGGPTSARVGNDQHTTIGPDRSTWAGLM
jgi:hypothetical protein